MLTYLHHDNQGPDVGKFKSEFPSDFHLCFHHSYSGVGHLNFQQNDEFRSEISIALFQKQWRTQLHFSFHTNNDFMINSNHIALLFTDLDQISIIK